jgi:hypothetical protein
MRNECMLSDMITSYDVMLVVVGVPGPGLCVYTTVVRLAREIHSRPKKNLSSFFIIKMISERHHHKTIPNQNHEIITHDIGRRAEK